MSTNVYDTHMTTMTPQQYSTLMTAIGGLEKVIGALREVLSNDGTETVSVPGQGEWTHQDVRQVWRLTEHMPGARALLHLTALAALEPGKPVTFSEVVEQTPGMTSKQQRADHAGLSRMTRAIFGSKRWPLEAWQHADGEARYRMHPTVAGWIFAAKEED